MRWPGTTHSFVFLNADAEVLSSIRMVDRLRPDYVVVRGGKPEKEDEEYYAYSADELFDRLRAGWKAKSSFRQALELHASNATPLIAKWELPDFAERRAIVHEDGRVLGVYDAEAPSKLQSRPGSTARDGG